MKPYIAQEIHNMLTALKQAVFNNSLEDIDIPEEQIDIALDAIETEFPEVLLDGDVDFDDSMDGDAASALASAGYGTDEDYGSADN